ncbi:MAG: ACT domain-containing protein [Candidatus Syntropharchaeia archaeon]
MIKQVSVFVENKPGRLSSVTKKLKEGNINIRAFTIAEAGDFGVIRLVVDNPKKAMDLLHGDFMVSETEVLGVEMEDRPGALHEIASVLGENNINIGYAYAFVTGNRALLILKVDDIESASEILKKRGLKSVDSINDVVE